MNMFAESIEFCNSTLGFPRFIKSTWLCWPRDSHGQTGWSFMGSEVSQLAWIVPSHGTRFVQVAKKSYKPIELYYGVPQGSILTPFLLLIYDNNIGSALQRGRGVQFAEDTTLCLSEQSMSLMGERSFLELNNGIQYFNSLNIKTNASKYSLLTFGLRPREVQSAVPSWCWKTPYWRFTLQNSLYRGLTRSGHIYAVCAKPDFGIVVLSSWANSGTDGHNMA